MHAAFDGKEIVGGAGVFPFEMTVPGGPVPCAGVTVVGVLPTHRREGLLSRMMRAQIDDIHEREEPFAALWASEPTIYGRFGYGHASHTHEIRLPRVWAALRADTPGRAGRVRLVEQDEAVKTLPRLYEKVGERRRIPLPLEGVVGATPPARRSIAASTGLRAAEPGAPRDRRACRRLRALPHRAVGGGRALEAEPARRRGARTRSDRNPRDLAFPARGRLDRRDPGLAPSHRSPGAAPRFPVRSSSTCGSAPGSGCGRSTSERPSPRGATAPTAGSRSSSGTRSARGTRARGLSPTGSRSDRAAARIFASTCRRSAPRTSAASRSRSSREPVWSRRRRVAGSPARMRSSSRTGAVVP